MFIDTLRQHMRVLVRYLPLPRAYRFITRTFAPVAGRHAPSISYPKARVMILIICLLLV